jgi:serine/threonine-protein kinase
MHAHAPITISSEASPSLETAPSTIGRFNILGEIGRGSNGVVYAARDPVLGREVAIKTIPLTSENEFRQKIEENFIKEAQAAASLNHPHIVTVFDAGKTDALAYMAMERLHGRDLHEQLALGPRLEFRQAAALMARVADALHYAHKRGLIHRDIKPSNIFLSRSLKPKILDFGVALAAQSDLDPASRRQIVGTPNYMSPEQALGKPLDPRSDVFSAGSILYELVAGRRAFEEKAVEDTLAAVVRCEPTPVETLRPEAPPELVRIIRRAMAKSPSDRYQTAGDLRNELAAFAGQQEFGGDPPPAATGALNPAAGPAKWVGAAVAGVAIGVALVAWYLWYADRRAPAPEVKVVVPQASPIEHPVQPAPPLAEPAPVPAPSARTPRLPETKAAPFPVPAPPPADGTIALAISPWGEVFVDGTSRGVSPPLERLALAPGAYSIEIRNSAAPTYSARVEVKSGQTVKLQHRF